MQYNQVEASINFRTVKNKETGEETKRDSIKIHFPVPAWESVIDMIANGVAPDANEVAKNNLQLLQDAMFNILFAQASEIAKENSDLNSANFPLSELDWEKIANAPEAERKSRGISKEEWADFAEDYLSVMPAITGKDPVRIERAVAQFIVKFQPIKSDKKSVAVLRDQLAVYAETAPNAANHYKVIEFLLKKAEALLSAEVLSADDY